ncbi:MAG: anthranilate synthase component II [Bacteroidota bacterium]
MKILVIDNYDSFTYNLVHYIERVLKEPVEVRRNDKLTIEEAGLYDKILISPGPGIPDEAGLTKEIIRTYAPVKSILGVCLGHQAIAEVFGGSIRNMNQVFHGVSSMMTQTGPEDYLFAGVPKQFEAGRYHSWIVEKDDLPAELEITALSEEGLIMALKHREYDVRGVQFHPESVLTEYGGLMILNWLNHNEPKHTAL